MSRITIFFTIVLYSCSNVFAQNAPISEYSRSSLTILVNEQTEYKDDILPQAKNVSIPQKFDNHNLDISIINAPKNATNILGTFNKTKLTNEVVAKWYNRNAQTGRMDMTLVHQRGMYNATDNDIIKASGTKTGLATIKDAGEKLMDKSYIMVLDFRNIKSMQEIYDADDATRKAIAEKTGGEFKPVNRVKNGWTGKAKAYLFKLSFTDTTFNQIYSNLWIYDDDTPEIQQTKKDLFNQTTFPVIFIAETYADADGAQYNADHILAPPQQLSRNELFLKMINSGLVNCITDFENMVEDFKVKAPLYTTNPIAAKIGRKEGLRTEQRYFVLEFEQTSKGTTKAKRKGVVRAKKVIDNRQVATGTSTAMSTFYQTAGQSLEPGMLLRQQNDLGIGVSVGTAFGNISGGFIKAEVNFPHMFSNVVDLGVTQIKVFGSLGFDTKEYTISGTPYDFTFTRLQIGISKGFYFARNFSVSPFISYGIEDASNDDYLAELNLDEDDYISTQMMNFGINGSLNVVHWLQIIGGVTVYTPFGDTFNKDNEPFDFAYTDIFKNRKGSSIDVGLRIEF